MLVEQGFEFFAEYHVSLCGAWFFPGVDAPLDLRQQNLEQGLCYGRRPIRAFFFLKEQVDGQSNFHKGLIVRLKIWSSEKVVQKCKFKKALLIRVAQQEKMLGKKHASAPQWLVLFKMMELVGRDKKQRARQDVVFPVVNDLGAAPFIKPEDFVKGVLVGVLDVEFAHFLEAGDFKIEQLLGSVDEMPNVVVREDVLHGVKVGIFRNFG